MLKDEVQWKKLNKDKEEKKDLIKRIVENQINNNFREINGEYVTSKTMLAFWIRHGFDTKRQVSMI